MSDTRYRLTAAWLQLGDAPPYNCVPIPVRMKDGEPEVQINCDWLPFPKDAARPEVKTYAGKPVAGIASDWEPER